MALNQKLKCINIAWTTCWSYQHVSILHLMYVLNNRSDLLPCKLDVLTSLIRAWGWCCKPHTHLASRSHPHEPTNLDQKSCFRKSAQYASTALILLWWLIRCLLLLDLDSSKDESRRRSFRSEMLSGNSRWKEERYENKNPRRRPSSSSRFSL